MKTVNAYSLLMFYVCLNLGFYIVAATNLIPAMEAPEFESPTSIQLQLITSFVTAATTSGLVAAIAGSLVAGSMAGLVVFAFMFFIGEGSVFYWVFYGFPDFFSSFAEAYGVANWVTSIFSGVILGLGSVVWFWFLITLVSGRYVET